jgi:hypothetical protein
MKKLLTSALLAVFMSVGLLSGSVGAVGNTPQTEITGVVTENHVAVSGAMVTVLCKGNTKTDTTDAFGSYLVSFDSVDCPFGVTVKVTAEKDGKTGVRSGTVQGITTKLNLAIVNVPIPEYGLIGSLTAGGAGLGMIVYRRRRQQQAQMQ